MAHELTEVDLMFYTGEKPWHKLGVELPELATAAEAIEAANLGWNVGLQPLYIETVDDSGSPNVKRVSDRMATVRDDIQEALGVVSLKYQPIQNVEAFAFMDDVTMDPNGPKYVTAGSLMRGKRVWALAKLPTFIEVTQDDIVEEYLLMSTSHDGTLMFNVMWTPIRVVCNNTLSMALSRAKRDKSIRIRHLGNIQSKITEAQNVLGIMQNNHLQLQELTNYLVDIQPTEEQVEKVMLRLFRTDDKKDVISIDKLAPQSQTAIHDILLLAQEGAGNAQVAGTAWALYNGVTEWSDHFRKVGGTKEDVEPKKLFSNWWGGSAQLKNLALETIKDECKIEAA